MPRQKRELKSVINKGFFCEGFRLLMNSHYWGFRTSSRYNDDEFTVHHAFHWLRKEMLNDWWQLIVIFRLHLLLLLISLTLTTAGMITVIQVNQLLRNSHHQNIMASVAAFGSPSNVWSQYGLVMSQHEWSKRRSPFEQSMTFDMI